MSIERNENISLLNNALFLIQYVNFSAVTCLKYTLCGAVLGYGSGLLLTESLTKFAIENPDAVNLDGGNHVPDHEQYLSFSRDSQFNKVTPPISEVLPLYSTALGAGAGLLFGLNKTYTEFSEKFKNERELNRLDASKLMV